MRGTLARLLARLHAFPVLKAGPLSVSGLSVAKTVAKLGLLWLLYAYVACVVDLVGGDTLKAVWDGETPPHRRGMTPDEMRRVRDIPKDLSRVMDALQAAASDRLRG